MLKSLLKTHAELIWWQSLSVALLVASLVTGIAQMLTRLPAWLPVAGFALALMLWLVGSQSALALARRREGVAEFLGVPRIRNGDQPREVYSLGDGVRLMHTGVLLVGLVYLLSIGGGLLVSDDENLIGRYAHDAGFRVAMLAVASAMMLCFWVLQLQLIARIERWYAETKSLVRLPDLSAIDAARVALA